MNGLRLAVSWLTVLPVRGPENVDRAGAGRAIALAPLVGGLLGAGTAGLLWVLTWVGASSMLAGLLAVGVLALITRGMHLDGLADTMDGLGSYGPPERARQIMKSGGAGPFGVAAIVFSIGVQAFSFAALTEADRWFAVALAVTVGRVAVVLACRNGIDAAPEANFGALVAGTQHLLTAAAWSAAAVAAAVFATPVAWQGPVAIFIALAASTILIRHCVRRFDGLSGDTLGAAIELTVSLAAATLSICL